MERIKVNPKAVVCPVIEEVNDKTFQYKVGVLNRFTRTNLAGHKLGTNLENKT